jgi:hypothetical protein
MSGGLKGRLKLKGSRGEFGRWIDLTREGV